jgi:hypothetical protein
VPLIDPADFACRHREAGRPPKKKGALWLGRLEVAARIVDLQNKKRGKKKLSWRGVASEVGHKNSFFDRLRARWVTKIFFLTGCARSGSQKCFLRPPFSNLWEIFHRGELSRARVGGNEIFATYSSQSKRRSTLDSFTTKDTKSTKGSFVVSSPAGTR